MRRAFTLLELMIAISLLSIIMLYLYQTLSTLQTGNSFYGERLDRAEKQQKILRTLYLDLALSDNQIVTIVNEEKDHDIVLMRSLNSVHGRIKPYIGYIFNDNGLFRIESSDKLEYPLSRDLEMQVDYLGDYRQFRIYRSKVHFLADLIDAEGEAHLFKIRGYHQQNVTK